MIIALASQMHTMLKCSFIKLSLCTVKSSWIFVESSSCAGSAVSASPEITMGNKTKDFQNVTQLQPPIKLKISCQVRESATKMNGTHRLKELNVCPSSCTLGVGFGSMLAVSMVLCNAMYRISILWHVYSLACASLNPSHVLLLDLQASPPLL